MFLTENQVTERTSKTQLHVESVALVPRRVCPLTIQERPLEEKVLLGTLAKIDGVRETARAFDRNPGHIEQYAMGRNTQRGEVNPELRDRIQKNVNNFRERLSNLAGTKLQTALETMTDDKIKSVESVKDLATIANSLATVHSKITERDIQAGSNVQINIFRPRTRDENEFEVISVEE
jgi:hypothetical protein